MTTENAVALVTETAKQMLDWTQRQVDLIRRTCAKDCNDDEFAVFLNYCRRLRLDPQRKQIMAMVTNKNDPKRRQLVVIVRIDGQRAIAARTNRYRPSDTAPLLEFDETLKGPLNPLGIVRAEVKVFQRDADTNEWYPIVAEAYWDEYAPVEEEWAEDQSGKRRPTGNKKLRDTWVKMGRLMIAKCAEALALRKGWPEDVGGVYDEAEMERAVILEEETDSAEAARLERIGYDREAVGNSALLTFDVGHLPRRVPLDKVRAEIETWANDVKHEGQITDFRRINAAELKYFWAKRDADALAVKKALEAKQAALQATPR